MNYTYHVYLLSHHENTFEYLGTKLKIREVKIALLEKLKAKPSTSFSKTQDHTVFFVFFYFEELWGLNNTFHDIDEFSLKTKLV